MAEEAEWGRMLSGGERGREEGRKEGELGNKDEREKGAITLMTRPLRLDEPSMDE